MTRLGFLLGEGIPGTARIPMEDKNEKKVFHFPLQLLQQPHNNRDRELEGGRGGRGVERV